MNPLMNVLVLEEHRMYLISNPVASFGEYHNPNNVHRFSLNEGKEKAVGMNDIVNQRVLENYINNVSA